MKRRMLAQAGLLGMVSLVMASAGALAGSTSFGGSGVAVTAIVDEEYCATGGVQCTQLGGTTDAAATDNNNPVKIVVQVINPNNLQPVSGLPPLAFSLSTASLPAGGDPPVLVACADCFQTGTGTYTMFAQPSSLGTWKEGLHASVLEISVGAIVLRTLIRIEIPFP